MTTINDEQFVKDKLSYLETIPPRNVEKAASTRAQYLSEMQNMISIKPVAKAVSIPPRQRLNEWIKNIQHLSLRKERYPMLTTLATIMTVLVLAFGGAGATVYAAQDSLPNDLLYPVKMASEQFRMDISTEAQTQFQLSLEFANRRMGEVAALESNGEAIPEEIMTQLKTEFKNAFQLAAGMNNDELTPALLKLQETIRQQQQTMAQLSSSENEAVLARIREMLQTQNQICESGLADPLMFRIRVRQQQNGDLTPPSEEPANTGSGTPQGNQGQGTGASTGGNSDANTGTSTGSSNSGTGSGTCTDDCVPVQDGTGPGPGPDAGNGEGSENSTPSQDGTGESLGPNENPGAGGESNNDTGNGNSSSDNDNSDNGGSNTNDTSTPGSGGSEDSGGGKGKP